jgi:hypothetical protein
MRIQQLRGYLDPNNPQFQPKQQHANTKAVIKLYEDRKIDGLQQVYIMEGKVVTRQEMFTWAWGEAHFFKSLSSIRTHLTNGLKLQGTHYQLAQKFQLSRSKRLGFLNFGAKFLLSASHVT